MSISEINWMKPAWSTNRCCKVAPLSSADEPLTYHLLHVEP
jgi:hypothetical protein